MSDPDDEEARLIALQNAAGPIARLYVGLKRQAGRSSSEHTGRQRHVEAWEAIHEWVESVPSPDRSKALLLLVSELADLVVAVDASWERLAAQSVGPEPAAQVGDARWAVTMTSIAVLQERRND